MGSGVVQFHADSFSDRCAAVNDISRRIEVASLPANVLAQSAPDDRLREAIQASTILDLLRRFAPRNDDIERQSGAIHLTGANISISLDIWNQKMPS
jgi:hypothetical protein